MSTSAPTASSATTPALSAPRRASQRLFSTIEGVFHEEVFFLILSVFIGIFSGLAVVCFRLAIDWTHLALLGPLPENQSWRYLFCTCSQESVAAA
jgi:CIC family chloride channel protein